jgi:hypothetical protein
MFDTILLFALMRKGRSRPQRPELAVLRRRRSSGGRFRRML